MSFLEEKLLAFANANLNVLFIGSHGIGKSTVIKKIADQLGLNFKYYSSSTLDPWADLVGVPVPNHETKSLDFYRPRSLDEAEMVCFDELNRAHPRVLNAVLEIIQFKSINGEPLPKLKMVWAAINPPGEDYQVEDMDDALVDRFHCYIKMKADINSEFMNSVMRPKVAKVLKEWWHQDLSADHQKIITPRRIEYIGRMIDADLNWRDALPQGHKFPAGKLQQKLKILWNEVDGVDITANLILNKPEQVLELYAKDRRAGHAIASCIADFEMDEVFHCKDLLESLTKEEVGKAAYNKWDIQQMELYELFRKASVDPMSAYPKIAEMYKFEDIKGKIS